MITPHPSAPEGEVKTLDTYSPSTFYPPCIILCRNTAPLVGFAYSLLQRDVPCTILGRDIGASLIALVKKMRAQDLPSLIVRLGDWRAREIARLDNEGRSPERCEDQYQCVMFFVSGLDEDSQTVPDLLAKIELMFSEDAGTNKVILSTIHKAKGLEYPTVFILDRHLCPSKFARLPWQKEQERNLMFVAITRSQDKLFYINSGNWKTQQD